MAHFQTPGDPGQAGGIFKAQGEELLQTKGKGGVILYLYVDNLSATMEVGGLGDCKFQKLTVFQEIVAAGGTSIAEPQKESIQGTLQLFEDTEGNCLGLYTWQPPTPNQSDSGN